jgi:hypothetical protein
MPGDKVPRSTVLDTHIEESWKIEEKRNPNIRNGQLLRLEKLIETPTDLILKIALTDYQEYKATCVPEHKKRFELREGRTFRSDEKAHTFASAVLPVTLDGKVVFLERSYQVDLFKGFLNLPSGGVWDGDPKKTIKKLLGYSHQGLFGVCKAIVEREFRKIESDIRLNEELPKLYGVAETLEHGDSTFDDHVLEFSVDLDEDTDTLQRKKDKITVGKYGDLIMVDFKEAEFADFLNENMERIPESIQPVAIIAGAHKFGEDWPLSIKGVRKI